MLRKIKSHMLDSSKEALGEIMINKTNRLQREKLEGFVKKLRKNVIKSKKFTWNRTQEFTRNIQRNSWYFSQEKPSIMFITYNL